jgi:hypothetical protein
VGDRPGQICAGHARREVVVEAAPTLLFALTRNLVTESHWRDPGRNN